MDPAAFESGQYGPSSDVYALGVTMLQLLTSCNDLSGLISTAQQNFEDVLAEKIPEWPLESAQTYARLAAQCVSSDPALRPQIGSGPGNILAVLGTMFQQTSILFQTATGFS